MNPYMMASVEEEGNILQVYQIKPENLPANESRIKII